MVIVIKKISSFGYQKIN